MHTLTKAEINWRAIIYLAIAFLTPIQAILAANKPITPDVWLAAVIASLITLRAFMDKSAAQGEGAMPMEVEVMNTPDNAVPTAETHEESTMKATAIVGER